MFEKVLLNRSSLIIVNSSNTEASVRRWLKTAAPLRVCRPGSDTIRAPDGPATADGRESSEREVRLLTVGNVIPRKGHLNLVVALSTMSELGWHLTVVGKDAPHTRYSRRLHAVIDAGGMEDRVSFTGTVEDEELVRHYGSADLFLFPSSHEGYGIALAEALCFGLPYIAFDSGGIREVSGRHGELETAQEGGYGTAQVPGDAAPPPADYGISGVFRCRGGFLVDRDRPEVFRAVLRRLIEDGELRRRLSDEARERAGGLPTWKETGACFHRALRDASRQV
jgi:glycosyltransferase involved in cell wall biosynthesis